MYACACTVTKKYAPIVCCGWKIICIFAAMKNLTPRISIIGAGAAGCFCAVELKRRMPGADVHVYEAGNRALAKVAITGGGRCNLTNTFAQVHDLRDVYPRGDKLMRRALSVLNPADTWQWWERQGVSLVAQADECVFPQSQNAMEVVDTLLRLMRQSGVVLHLRHRVQDIRPTEPTDGGDDTRTGGYLIYIKERTEPIVTDMVVVTTGGHPRPSGFDMLRHLQLQVVSPVPSLFTLNVQGDWHQTLMGTVVEHASVQLCGTKFRTGGPLLLTHWGMSGPAILKLSSHAARYLAEHQYVADITVNWLGDATEDETRRLLADYMTEHGAKQVTSVYPTCLTQRHWTVLLQRCGIPLTQRWNALNRKHQNRLVTMLTADPHHITGRCRYREEFVTCGGVSLGSINISTMEAKHHPGLYLAGEVLDVDAVTGGFNLQAAWSMAMTVAISLHRKSEDK